MGKLVGGQGKKSRLACLVPLALEGAGVGWLGLGSWEEVGSCPVRGQLPRQPLFNCPFQTLGIQGNLLSKQGMFFLFLLSEDSFGPRVMSQEPGQDT